MRFRELSKGVSYPSVESVIGVSNVLSKIRGDLSKFERLESKAVDGVESGAV